MVKEYICYCFSASDVFLIITIYKRNLFKKEKNSLIIGRALSIRHCYIAAIDN